MSDTLFGIGAAGIALGLIYCVIYIGLAVERQREADAAWDRWRARQRQTEANLRPRITVYKPPAEVLPAENERLSLPQPQNPILDDMR